MKNIFLETQSVIRFREAAENLRDMDRGQPGLMLVFGQSGRGKTTCCERYAAQTGAVYFRVWQRFTELTMLQHLCQTVNGMRPRTIDKCKRVLVEEMDSNPNLIIVDEADRLTGMDMVEHFRDIHDTTGAPFVFVGEQVIYSKFASRRRIWRRITETVEFGRISAEDIILIGLKAAELKISPRAATMIAHRSKGTVGDVWLMLYDLEKMAKANGSVDVSHDMVDNMPRRKIGPKPEAGGKKK